MAVGSKEGLGSALVSAKYMDEAQTAAHLLILLPKRSTGGGAGRKAGALATLHPGAARMRSARVGATPEARNLRFLTCFAWRSYLSSAGKVIFGLFSSVGHER